MWQPPDFKIEKPGLVQTKSGFFAFSVEQFSKLFPPCVSASAPRRVVLANPTCGPACIFRRTTARITVQRTVLHCFRAALAVLSANSTSRCDRYNVKMENHVEVSPGWLRSRWVSISKIPSHTKNTSCITSIRSVGIGFQPYWSF